MKKITTIALMLFTAFSYAQVGVNTNTPDASSALEIESTTGGILIPRLTQTQRDAITEPATGLMIYQTNQTSGFYFFDGTVWTKINGVAGPQGEAGSQGVQGIQGDIGLTGATGPSGANGANGADGSAGAQGAQGEAGSQGIQGLQGDIGLTGATGPSGSNGADGSAGAQGPQGEAGSQGIQGTQGDIGLTGATGPSGANGANGATGPQGPAGADGNDGATGEIGTEGNGVSSTVQNDDGTITFNYTDGTSFNTENLMGSTGNGASKVLQSIDTSKPTNYIVTQNQNSSTNPYTTQISTNGYSGFYKLIYRFSSGNSSGSSGTGHFSIKDPNGNVLHNSNGSYNGGGQPEKYLAIEIDSSWDYIQLEGYCEPCNGQFIVSPVDVQLVLFNDVVGQTGPAGTQGATGMAGPTGPQGAPGNDGATGATGPAGASGINGTTGSSGANGANGSNGIDGAQGDIGLTGATGPSGANGTNGSNGIDGQDGTQGINGSTSYELWQDAGNIGTEAEFLASLVGPEGPLVSGTNGQTLYNNGTEWVATSNLLNSGASVGIGLTATIDASAVLQVESTTQGVLFPKMTLVERDLISSPQIGLLVFQTDTTPGFYFYDGSSWVALNAANGSSSGGSNPKTLIYTSQGF